MNSKGDLEGTEQEEVETNKNDHYGLKCIECSGFGHIQANCRNLKQAKRKVLHATLSDDSETPGKDSKLLVFVASHNNPNKSHYSKSSDEEDLEEVYEKLYIKFMKLREVNQKKCWN
jgi:hypothetical protein